MKNIYIGGIDRSGTTLLSSFLGGIEGYTVVNENPYKFEELIANSSFKLLYSRFLGERNDTKYGPVTSCVQVIDSTPKNWWFINALRRSNYVVLIKRNFFDLYGSHKKIKWGIKNPLKFGLYYGWFTCRTYLLKGKKNVIVLHYEKLVVGGLDYLNLVFQPFGLKSLNRVELELPLFTLEQHSNVNSELKLVTYKIPWLDRSILILGFAMSSMFYFLFYAPFDHFSKL